MSSYEMGCYVKQKFRCVLDDIKTEIEKIDKSNCDSSDKLLKLSIIENKLRGHSLSLCNIVNIFIKEIDEAELMSEEIFELSNQIAERSEKIKNKKPNDEKKLGLFIPNLFK